MATTKVKNKQISGAPISVFDYMTAAEIAAVQTDTWSGAVTNVNAAVQAAIDAAAPLHKLLVFPNGTYRITTTLTIYPGTTMQGGAGWSFPASYGGTYSSRFVFKPATAIDMFIIAANPNNPTLVITGPSAGFWSKISIKDLIFLGDATTAQPAYCFDLTRVIYSNFANLTITGFNHPFKCYNTINNRFENCYLTGVVACVRYSATATTDVWDQCAFWGSPIAVQTIGATIGIRFKNCLFEQIDHYVADLVKETESMIFDNCYTEDCPFKDTAAATDCVFRVGHDGTSLVVENHLIVIGGKYAGRNPTIAFPGAAAIIGSFIDADYCSGIQVISPNVSRFTNLVTATANTLANSIVFAGWAGIGITNVIAGTAGRVAGMYSASGIESGTRDQVFAGATVTVSGYATAAVFSGYGGRIWVSGGGSPEGALAAAVGSIYSRTDGSAGTSFYVKESGAGNTGWVPMETAGASVASTAAAIAAVANAINTAAKFPGKRVWDATNSRYMVASGVAAADPWYSLSGATVVTPA